MRRRPRLSEPPRDVTTAADPVAAFFDAHEAGVPVALRTSGTSGTGRNVVRTTRSWVSSFDAVSALTGTTDASRVWVPGPLTATMNLFAAVHARFAGAELVEEQRGASHAHLTPAQLVRALDAGAVAGMTVVVAGDRLAPSLHDRAVDAGAHVHHYYGASELSFVGWGGHAEDLRPFPDVDVSIRDGVVWVRSPYLCSGYAGPGGALRRSADGFATVGDRGALHDGRLVVLGRDDAVTTAGTTVAVADVEALLRRGATGLVAVLGLPHGGLGSVLAAVLTCADDHGTLLELARTRLDPTHRPRMWFHLADLPLTGAGKVDRGALVSRLSGDAGRAHRLV